MQIRPLLAHMAKNFVLFVVMGGFALVLELAAHWVAGLSFVSPFFAKALSFLAHCIFFADGLVLLILLARFVRGVWRAD